MDENPVETSEDDKEQRPSLSQSTVAVRNREARAVELALAKVPYEQIAREVGYSNASGAHHAVMRALRRSTTQAADAILDTELATLDRAQRAVYPKVLSGDVKSVNALLKIMERRARYLGLDHADGIAERHIKLEEDKVAFFAVAIRAVLDGLNLTPEQRALEPQIVAQQLATMVGVPIDTTATIAEATELVAEQSPAVDNSVEKPRYGFRDRYPPAG